jgi:anti-sigma-K factor RskA
MTSPDIHTLTGAYAFDALSDTERAAFERHLAQCPACTQEVAELRETTALLGAAAAVSPPERLRETVLAEVSRTRQNPPPQSLRSRRRLGRWPAAMAAAAAAAAIAAAVVLGVRQVHTQNRLDTVTDRLAAVTAVLQAPDAAISQGIGATGARAVAVESPSQHRVAVLVTGLPPVPADRTYQLWLIAPQGAVSAGLLGRGQTSEPVVADTPPALRSIGVTVEPAGGSPRPTTSPVVLLPL